MSRYRRGGRREGGGGGRALARGGRTCCLGSDWNERAATTDDSDRSTTPAVLRFQRAGSLLTASRTFRKSCGAAARSTGAKPRFREHRGVRRPRTWMREPRRVLAHGGPRDFSTPARRRPGKSRRDGIIRRVPSERRSRPRTFKIRNARPGGPFAIFGATCTEKFIQSAPIVAPLSTN